MMFLLLIFSQIWIFPPSSVTWQFPSTSQLSAIIHPTLLQVEAPSSHFCIRVHQDTRWLVSSNWQDRPSIPYLPDTAQKFIQPYSMHTPTLLHTHRCHSIHMKIKRLLSHGSAKNADKPRMQQSSCKHDTARYRLKLNKLWKFMTQKRKSHVSIRRKQTFTHNHTVTWKKKPRETSRQVLQKLFPPSTSRSDWQRNAGMPLHACAYVCMHVHVWERQRMRKREKL